ncbi:MAG: response regulator [Deltaproteobacteria bacterium]|jgi:DNA-binding response OmpR family regulator|nr:response regulator [Deltaproteobacteria bacterium]
MKAEFQTTAAPRILIVDDDQMIHKLLGAILQKAGFECLDALTGADGLKIAREHIPELIILDIMMPEMNGFDVMRALKSNPATANIPVIFLSGKFHNREKTQARELGAADFMEKPFERNELLARIRTYLTIRRQEDNLSFYNSRIVQMAREALGLLSQGQSGTELRAIPENLARRLEQSTQAARQTMVSMENQWMVFSAYIKPYLTGQDDQYYRQSMVTIPLLFKELNKQLVAMDSVSKELNAVCGLALPTVDEDDDQSAPEKPSPLAAG